MHLYRVIAVVLLCRALSGCGLAEDFAETQKKAGALVAALEKDLGARPEIGWKIHNGALTDLTVAFSLDAVSSLAVGDLESRVRARVLSSFDTPPQTLMVSVVSRR